MEEFKIRTNKNFKLIFNNEYKRKIKEDKNESVSDNQ